MAELYQEVIVGLGADTMPVAHTLAVGTDLIEEERWVPFVERDDVRYVFYQTQGHERSCDFRQRVVECSPAHGSLKRWVARVGNGIPEHANAMQPFSIQVRNHGRYDVYTVEKIPSGLWRPRNVCDLDVVRQCLVKDGNGVEEMEPRKQELQQGAFDGTRRRIGDVRDNSGDTREADGRE